LNGDKLNEPRRGIRAIRADQGHGRVRSVLDAERLRVVTMVDAAEGRPLRSVSAVTEETAFAAPNEASAQDERPRTDVLNRRSPRPERAAKVVTGRAGPAQSQSRSRRNACERDDDHRNKNTPPPHPPFRFSDQRVERERATRERGEGHRLPHVLDDLDQFFGAVALLASEADKLASAGDNGSSLGCTGDVDATTTSELQQAFIAKQAKRAENGVRVHAKHGGEITGGREPFAWLCFAVGDSAPDLGGHLLEQVRLFLAVDLDVQHWY
jgi:hypothetical protein